VVEPPDGGQPRRSTGRPGQPRPAAELTPDEAAGARLAPGEQARIDESVVRVARRGRGPTIAAALVAAAFLVGLVRPWDWLAGGSPRVPAPAALVAEEGPTTASPQAGVAGVRASGRADGDAEPAAAAPTCAYPAAWRTATIQMWAGARARVWTAAEAVAATTVDDPSIPFNIVASDTVEAIGWCAPVTGPDRPPLAAVATLFRLEAGVASEVAVDRLEPAVPDALGKLWLPPGQAGGRRPLWAPGRYVIRLAAPSGGYQRYLGIQVGLPKPGPTLEPEPERMSGQPPAQTPESRPAPGSDPAP
jgi:hypothetical protein